MTLNDRICLAQGPDSPSPGITTINQYFEAISRDRSPIRFEFRQSDKYPAFLNSVCFYNSGVEVAIVGHKGD
ncbi:hypothetical protein IV203_008350 [Nitzschia inconspicua]|uniref:Uncharacterized protein n=1 Tax=Nitzschia inconspicua TaxID=303405 RepID=A0A9K3PLY5_9STRA|nr:hypothetical protein IV203_008350 [Nitzschia inconspicua]